MNKHKSIFPNIQELRHINWFLAFLCGENIKLFYCIWWLWWLSSTYSTVYPSLIHFLFGWMCWTKSLLLLRAMDLLDLLHVFIPSSSFLFYFRCKVGCLCRKMNYCNSYSELDLLKSNKSLVFLFYVLNSYMTKKLGSHVSPLWVDRLIQLVMHQQ